jgi:L-arabinokinase
VTEDHATRRAAPGAPAVAFYISGHGFGHAVRQIAIVNALQRLAGGDIRVLVRTSAPAWLFDRTLRESVTLQPGPTDTGVVQIDGLRLDEEETVAQAAAFHASLPRLVRDEADLLHRHRVRFVVADAPPLACAAAAEADIPAAVCSNFTWDWIYEAYLEGRPERDGIMTAIRRAYGTAAGWRLPFHGGFEWAASIVDVPLVARHAREHLTRGGIRRTLGLPPARPLVLVSFGGYGARDLPLDRLDCLEGWGVVTTTRGPERVPPEIHAVSEERMYREGLRYEELVHAVDVVLTKPGYGIVADCIANDTALLYTSRGRFREYDVLVAGMPRYLRTGFIEMSAFLEGRWADALGRLASAPAPPERMATDGADTVAAMILDAVTRAG